MVQSIWMRAALRSSPVLLITFFVILLFGAIASGGQGQEERFVFVRRGNIWIANAKGGCEKQLTYSGQNREPAISSDGRWVAYISGSDEAADMGHLFLIPAEGGPAKRFALRNVQWAAQPSFSPDGTSLIFVGLWNMKTYGIADETISFAQVGLVVIDLLSLKSSVLASNADVLIDTGHVYAWPSFSPDGKQVAYNEHSLEGATGVEIVDAAGKAVFRFPQTGSDGASYWRPRFDRDGGQVLCYSPAPSPALKDTVYLVSLSRSKKRKVVEGSNPTFVSNGKAIIFERAATDQRGSGAADLWYLDLQQGAMPKKVATNGSQPSGRPMAR
jgi:Tol biopolymer transport system component